MTPVEPVDYNTISDSVRRFCTERYFELERALRPLVDGSFGEIAPAHLVGYLGVLKQLTALYQANKPPIDQQNLISMDKVQEIIARMNEQHEQAIMEAVSQAEARVRTEIASGSKLSIEAAKTTVLSKLSMLEGRGTS
jgi:hypothetical protein